MRRARSKRVTGSSVCTTASAVCRPTPGWVRSRTTRASAAARVASSWLTAAICASNVVSRTCDCCRWVSGELGVERAHVVAAVVERVLVDLSVGCIHPADGLGADMQVNSDVHCHSRLLFKPKPNGSGREYQLSPRRRVSHDITYKKG